MISRSLDKSREKDDEDVADLGDEMPDILFVLFCLANQTGVDLEATIEHNFTKKDARDKDRHTANPKLG